VKTLIKGAGVLPHLSDNQVTVACATLEKLCQISLLPLRTEQHHNIIRDQYNQPSELHFDEPKNACTIRDNITIIITTIIILSTLRTR
jgi:hypothetical protein